MCLFFFKQKTAYEMRISDWSSDVCSSDLETLSHIAACVLEAGFRGNVTCGHCCSLALADDEGARATIALLREAKITVVTLPLANMHLQDRNADVTPRWRGVPPVKELLAAGVSVSRSEEHTSELQSLMRISYAVFCLKKKK